MGTLEVVDLRIFPVKGARGQQPPFLNIDAKAGIAGDRRFGIKRDANAPNVWANKSKFRVGANTPTMPAKTPPFQGGTGLGAFGRFGNSLDPRWLEELALEFGVDHVGLLDTEGAYNLVDTDPNKYGPTVSFLNMATARAIEEEAGFAIDPDRYRMNVWYEGKAFEELDWANDFPGTKLFKVGNLDFRIQDACERCRSVEADPTNGTYTDNVLPVIKSLLQKRGYKGSPHRGSFHVMGFLATPLSSGLMHKGDAIQLCG